MTFPLRRPTFAACVALWIVSGAVAQGLPPVPAPPQNPITPAKAVLGKVLFWDEQLSADDRVACGTCHHPEAGGADPRLGVHPGPDRRFGTADDKAGSPGVRTRDPAGAFAPHPEFGFDVQATRRTAPSAFGSQWAREQFWDGRAIDTFFDPDTGAMIIPTGGSLESQALVPLTNDVEMGAPGRTLADVVQKLTGVRPLALATNLPGDVQAALAAAPTYPDLFRAAFAPYYATPVYNKFLAWAGYEDAAATIREGWAEKDREKTGGALTDEMIDEIAIIGDEDEIRERIQEAADGGIDTAIIAPLAATAEGVQRTFDAFRGDRFSFR